MAFTVVFTAELAVTAYAHWFRRGPAPAAGSRAWLPLRLGRFVPFGSSICVFRAGGGSRPPLRLGREGSSIRAFRVDSCLSPSRPSLRQPYTGSKGCEGSSIRAFRAAYPVVPDASGVRSGTARVIGSRAPNARDWVARARA